MAAIYMWRQGQQIVITTTPYPVDVTETLVFGISIKSGSMDLLPEDIVTGNADMLGGSYTQTRWFFQDGPYEDTVEGNVDMLGGSYVQTRWFFQDGPYEDTVGGNADMLGGSLVNKLVVVDSPDEKLQLTCVIKDTCSMTEV